MFTKLRENKAFTLVEIMIVVAIIGLLIAIALPNFIQARNNTRRGLCANNVRLIGSAVEQDMISAGSAFPATNAALVTMAGPYIKGGFPACPSGTTANYIPTPATLTIGCNTAGHTATYTCQPAT